MRYCLENEILKVEVDSLGAELRSVQDKATGTEYMWQADPKYWKRTSPVLFPLVGNYKNKEMIYQGKKYPMSQHGFARDMEFTLESRSQDTLWLSLQDTPDTLAAYPFPFKLSIGYRLEARTVRVLWKVENTGKDTMYFSIGGHPAFNCPLRAGERQEDYYIGFGGVEEVVSTMIGEDGLATNSQLVYMLQEGLLSVTPNLFDNDALVVEGNQTRQVSLFTPDKKPYITVDFDAPLFGVWSQPGMEAPFVCIEPWYGRCDHTEFEGTLEQREWGNTLEAGQAFEASYSIRFE